MKKKAIVLLPTLLIIIVAIAIYLNPLRKSEDQIRTNLLKIAPIGTDMEELIKIIEGNKKWEIVSISNISGYTLRWGQPTFASPDDIASGKAIGKHSIVIYLGSYRNIFITGVDVFWGFDENSKLVDLHVRKSVDAL